MPRLTEFKVKLGIPNVLELEGLWRPDASERQAAWELYVELVTRVAVVELGPNEGLLREVLSSLHELFEITRAILRKYGPDVAKTKSGGDYSFGSLAVTVLNLAVRPFLSKWHPMLSDHERSRQLSEPVRAHETGWDQSAEFRADLRALRQLLMPYAELLGEVASVTPLMYDARAKP